MLTLEQRQVRKCVVLYRLMALKFMLCKVSCYVFYLLIALNVLHSMLLDS